LKNKRRFLDKLTLAVILKTKLHKMKISLNTIIWLSIILVMSSCNKTRSDESIKAKPKESFIDSLRSKSNKVEVTYYVDFLKSKIQIVRQSYTKTEFDSITRFFGNKLHNKCYLVKTTIPDGEIRFYNNEKLLTSVQFILDNDCQGLYKDFSQHSEKFELTEYGKNILKKNKPE
jgi:hypothetical protein